VTAPSREQDEEARRREARSRLGVPSVWEEPHFRGLGPDDAAARPAPMPSRHRLSALLIVVLVAVGGAVLAVLGAFFRASGAWGIVLVVVAAPAYEEIAKPLGILLMAETKSRWVFARWQIVLAAIIGAAVFSAIENVLYTYVYHPSGGPAFVQWRWTVCVALHLTASTITGLGLAREWHRACVERRHFATERVVPFWVAAIAVHGAYNGIVTILELTDVLKF
jgi:RsiW-degrading membrane proteinase PrsW (M82 family)